MKAAVRPGISTRELDEVGAAVMYSLGGRSAPKLVYAFSGENCISVNHVALGTDFDGGPTLARGMRDVRDLPMITDAMLRRGYNEQRINKFWGGNLLHFFRQVGQQRT
jgi:hypothetical protein